MKSLKLLPIVILLCCSVAVQASTNPQDIPLSFPFFQSGQSSGIRDQLMVGYGDWTTLDATLEGLHMGIDLYPESDADQVLNPFNSTMYSIGACYTDPTLGTYTGCMIGIGPEGSDYGWALEHMGVLPYDEQMADDWCEDFARGTVLTPGMPIDSCIDYSSGAVPVHTHIQWSHWITDGSPGGAQIYNPWDALVNPFNYFIPGVLDGYDQISFKAVWPEIWFFYPGNPTNTGAFFLPDGVESAVDYVTTVGEENKYRFQDIVYSAVDIVVSPFSELNEYPDNNGCGVYSLGYEILHQNPLDLNDWQSTASSQGNWEYRDLFMAEGQIEEPSLWVDIYTALFQDKSLFENAYIVTNSGALDQSSWTTGWDNVWIDPTNNDWVDGICRGAWDTNLQLPPNTGDAQTNADAFFPDGRYAVEVTAESHASRNTGTMTLPVDDLSLPEPQTEGVVVDNFLPHIVGVAAYAWDPATRSCDLIYESYWEDIPLDVAPPDESEYLEQLRADLHALQSEDRSNSLLSSCMIDLTESSNQSYVNQIGFSESERTSEEYSDILSTLQPGCCLDEGIGQDPSEFLMEEIARIENQLICKADNDRIFGPPIVYEYLPMDGSNLVLQVFYSEPTMVENLSRDPITDKLYFKGIIGGMTTYHSTRFGYFERLPSNFQLPLIADNASGSLMGSNTVDFDDSYVVHYLFNGTLPQQYVGNIQLFLGGSDLGFDEGPRDLAGNQMDSYPGTTAEPRINYGPFSNIGFETGPDINHLWKPPNWQHVTSTDIVYGFVGIEQDFVAAVNLNSIGLADCQFLGDCDYWCGFWLFRQISSTCSYAYIVKPDGSYLQFHLRIPGIGSTDVNVHPEYVIGDGRYCWLTGNFGGAPDYSASGTNAFRVDAEEEYVFSKNVCTGASWRDGSTVYRSGALFIEQYPNGQAQYYYGYWTVPWGPFFSGYVTLPSSSTNSNDATLISNTIEIDVEADEKPILEIQGNPISSNLGIICNSSTAQEYELVIYDISGRRVLVDSGVFNSTDSRVEIGVSNLPSGVYLLRIRTGDIEAMRTISIIH